MDPRAFLDKIVATVDRVFAAMDGLPPAAIAWQPAPEANSLGAIGTHVLGNLNEILLGLFLSADVAARDRDAEFDPAGASAEELRATWLALRARIFEAADTLDATALDRVYTHPRRGEMAGGELLLVIARHMAEHQGHAELTRQLWDARSRP